ncbi:hypothetical protein PDG61_24620 [Mycolicibacterium sp. BiH015]|uniref:hypothetical protein n=1 Tax=Mycolicibacterium sp. BiH015 TaxID=3018808 RepID=UPI0022E88893|nr:hypothetical protein [Mycolicibacterium sp. BiH015]MDA2894115.1 hypothetical protein [Mycolicibacterium sp. BiH015]
MSKAPARLRGTAAGLLTAALTLAAHGLAGGHLPFGATGLQLAVVAGIVGGLAASLSGDVRGLAALLALGQTAGHAVLAAHGNHLGAAAPTWVMIAAHGAATVLGAALISLGDRLCRLLSRAIRGAAQRPPAPVSAAQTVALRGADQPMRAALALASSISHRGPPVSASR